MGRTGTQLRIAGSLLTAFVIASESALGASFLPEIDARRVELEPTPGDIMVAVPIPPFADFDASLQDPAPGSQAQAIQDSSLGAHAWTGNGGGILDAGAVSGTSLFDLVFRVDESTKYVLEGRFVLGGEVLLEDQSGVLFSFETFPETTFLDTGFLDPGEFYRLRVGTPDGFGATPLGGSVWDFDFLLVPEPGTAVLLACGLAALGGARRRTRRTSMIVAALAGVWLPPADAGAAELIPIVDGRRVQLTGTVFVNGPPETVAWATVPTPPFSDFSDGFDVGAAYAMQTSTLDATAFSGSGGAFTDGGGDGAGLSLFDVLFQVDETVDYTLDGTLCACPGPASVLLESGSETLFDSTAAAFPAVGTLEPGVFYRLRASAESFEGDFYLTEYSFDFTLDDVQEVPEPGPLAWLAPALALIALHAHRERRAQRR